MQSQKRWKNKKLTSKLFHSNFNYWNALKLIFFFIFFENNWTNKKYSRNGKRNLIQKTKEYKNMEGKETCFQKSWYFFRDKFNETKLSSNNIKQGIENRKTDIEGEIFPSKIVYFFSWIKKMKRGKKEQQSKNYSK